ncbi:MAG: Rne/Rng family ribonuclease [Alphaproteobacteria bacterium]|nr:Rne/Rng family ribonuclease [Alphaproteobacteria bacterium]
MSKNILIDATHREETRVLVVDGNRIEEYDHETLSRKPIKGNIYLAKVTRVEPSLQAAFVDYGGNRHGFLAFSEIHPDYYRIPVEDRELLLAEEREENDRDHDHDHEELQREPSEQESSERGNAEQESFEPSSSDDAQDNEAPAAEASTVEDVPADMTVEEVGGASPPPVEDLETPTETAAHERESSLELSAGDISTSAYPSEEQPAAQDGEASISEPALPAEGGEIIPVQTGEEQSAPAAKPESVDTIGSDMGEDLRRRRRRLQRRYKIQEVIKRRQIILVQVTKEERGNKGAALTTYLSLPGRYCVLMPNTGRGGGISRKITNQSDRKRLKAIVDDLDPPEGMSLILRTAGQERTKAEVKRDYEYLIRLWDEIRERTLTSTAPALIYEEADVIKRAVRDLYGRGVEEVIVAGEEGYKTAKAFMKAMMPSHAKRVRLYEEPVPLFHRYNVEQQLETIQNPVVQLRSGGSIVINSTEALVAIDVNSGRATRERNIEETAYKTNLEAAEEVARQLRLRDLAGLIVIDFIDMEENRNNHAVERRLKEAMKDDRARIQIGRISHFGLLEMSRQRLRASLVETSTERCPICAGTGLVRSTETTGLQVLRAIEEEALKRRAGEITVTVPTRVALHLLNHARRSLGDIEERFALHIIVLGDDHMTAPAYKLEVTKQRDPSLAPPMPLRHDITAADRRVEEEEETEASSDEAEEAEETESTETGASSERSESASRAPREGGGEDGGRRRRRGRRGGRRRHEGDERPPQQERQPQQPRQTFTEPENRDQPRPFDGPDPWADPTLPETWANAVDEGGAPEGGAPEGDAGEDNGEQGAAPHADENRQPGTPGEEGERRGRRRRRRGRRGGRRFRERHGAVEGNGEAGAAHADGGHEQGSDSDETGGHDAPAGVSGDAPAPAPVHFEQPREPEPYHPAVREEPAPERPTPAAAAEPASSSESAKSTRRGWWNRLTEG